MIRRAFLWIAASCLLGLSAHAAIQGEVGESSTAITKIRLNVQGGIQIVNINDVELDFTGQRGDVEALERLCIHGNLGGNYSLLLEGTEGGSQPFTVFDSAGRVIPFEVYFLPDIDRDVGDRIFPGQRSHEYAITSNRAFCAENDNAAIKLVFPEAALVDARAGEYLGQLTLTVSIQ